MDYTFLGNTGVKISRISFGNWLTSDKEEWEDKTKTHMLKAWDLGVNFFDTAEAYGNGKAEKQFATGIKALYKERNVRRQDLVLSTKIYWENIFQPKGQNSMGLSRKRVLGGLKESLKRLEVDNVDIVFAHRFDRDTPLEETCRAFDAAINQGMTYYWGTSEWEASEIFEAFMICEKYGLHKPVAEQSQYNMMIRQRMEVDYARLFDKYGYGTTVWSPLLGGVLTGKYNDGIPSDCRAMTFDDNPVVKMQFQAKFGEKNKENYTKMLKGLGEIAKELECTQAQLAMAWVLAYNRVSTAITGCSSEKQLEDTIGSFAALKKLTPEVLEKIEKVLNNRPIQGVNMKTWKPLPNSR